MAHYTIDIDNQDTGADGGDWTAALFMIDNDGESSDSISVGIGSTVREAVADLDWHHDWTEYLSEATED